jgi:hypothetical protein
MVKKSGLPVQTLLAMLLIPSIGVLVTMPADIMAAEASNLVNVNPDPDGEPWIAGGITEEEWNRMISGLPSLDQIIPGGLSKTAAAALPEKVDNSVLTAFRPVFNQKGGSCAQASSIGYIFTYEINLLRGLPGNVQENQYPYDFSYNFCNAGSGNNGSNPNQGFDIALFCGIPDVKTYGGFGLGKYTQWMSGYDNYYLAMANRAQSQFTIKVNTTAGIDQMKQWLQNHGTGAANGGCLIFCYNATGEVIATLATGTPEAGKKVMPKFGTTGGHAVTIAGYNDSVRYDYNADGKYTNNIDITGDGTVDIKDWEIGALYMVNSWGTSFGNSGKIYIPYKMCADPAGLNGSTLYGMKTDQAMVKPKLTYKITMTHDNRSQIRLRAGYANNGTATAATGTAKSFGKAFNYAGGVFPMQGVNADPIEIGLDVSSLTTSLTASTVTCFLLIDSKGGAGTIQRFSVLDYRNGDTPVETVCSQENVAIPTGALTMKVVLNQGMVGVAPTDSRPVSAPSITRSGAMLSFSNAGDRASIIALNGARLFTRSLSANGSLDISALPRGVYLAKTGKAMLKFVR